MTPSVIYPSEKGKLTLVVFAVTLLLLLGVLFLAAAESNMLAIIIVCIPLFFLASLWTGTYYRLDDTFLYYKYGPFKGKLAIASIREIIKNKTLWVGFRPALSTKGLIIRYEKWNEIYISPEHKEAFLAELLKRNAHIQIKE
jgi:hypothetical protein